MTWMCPTGNQLKVGDTILRRANRRSLEVQIPGATLEVALGYDARNDEHMFLVRVDLKEGGTERFTAGYRPKQAYMVSRHARALEGQGEGHSGQSG